MGAERIAGTVMAIFLVSVMWLAVVRGQPAEAPLPQPPPSVDLIYASFNQRMYHVNGKVCVFENNTTSLVVPCPWAKP